MKCKRLKYFFFFFGIIRENVVIHRIYLNVFETNHFFSIQKKLNTHTQNIADQSNLHNYPLNDAGIKKRLHSSQTIFCNTKKKHQQQLWNKKNSIRAYNLFYACCFPFVVFSRFFSHYVGIHMKIMVHLHIHWAHRLWTIFIKVKSESFIFKLFKW